MWMLAGKSFIGSSTIQLIPITADWHADACCHSKAAEGHLILSLVLAHCFIEEEKIMLSYNEKDTASGERDFTMDSSPTMHILDDKLEQGINKTLQICLT